jgi:hypothetical protein
MSWGVIKLKNKELNAESDEFAAGNYLPGPEDKLEQVRKGEDKFWVQKGVEKLFFLC